MAAVTPPHCLATNLDPVLSTTQRYSLLLLFSLANFVDSFNSSGLFSALPELKETFDMTEGEAVWLISATQLTFASFLLISGRISDVYNPSAFFYRFFHCGLADTKDHVAEIAFIAGIGSLGVISIAAGFMTSKIPLIILRALSGIGKCSLPRLLCLSTDHVALLSR